MLNVGWYCNSNKLKMKKLILTFIICSITVAVSSEESNDAMQCKNKYTTNNCEMEKEMSDTRERTFVMVKPDGVQRGLVGEIIKRFEQKGFKLVGMKFMWPSKELLEKHYADLSSRPFFPGLIQYMSSGPVVPMVWEGLNVVKTVRVMLGATDPKDSAPGTIRGDFSIQVGRNIIHGSDAVESAKKEINLWFKPEEVTDWKRTYDNWIYEF